MGRPSLRRAPRGVGDRRRWPPSGPARLLEVEELDLKREGRVWRDHPAGSAGAVAELRRDRQPPGATDPHRRDALVPAADHPALAQWEGERLAAILRAVELCPVQQP